MFAILDRMRPSSAVAEFAVTLAFAVLLIWFGLMNISGAASGIVERWISGHMALKSLLPYKNYVMWGLGGLQAAAGLVIALHSVPDHIKRLAYWFVVIYSLGALSLLATNPVWIDSLGGFPAIGAGQGILKYLTLLGLALHRLNFRHADKVILAGLLLVLGWIGAMKFTGPEADGVWPLLTSSPVFNWWLPVNFAKQGASNVIGVIELVTVLLLTAQFWNTRLFRLGLLLAAGTFVVTLSFMVSYAPSWQTNMGGFPYLSSAGHFLLKDLPLLAATLLLASRS